MVRNRDQRFTNVVVVIRFRQLVTDARMIRVGKATRFARPWDESRIHGDANDVIPRRHRFLSVAAIEDEVLAAKLEEVCVGPSVADSLIAGNADQPTAAEVGWAWWVAGQ